MSTDNKDAQFIDALLVSDLLLESFGAESVVTTKAFQSDYVQDEIEKEADQQHKQLEDLVLQQSNDIFDEPDVDYSKQLSDTAGYVPSHSINIEDKHTKNDGQYKKKRKVWSHSQIVARMPPTSQTFLEPNVIIKSLEEYLDLSPMQSLHYHVQAINVNEEQEVDWCKEVQKNWPPSLLSHDLLVTLPFHTHQDCVDILKYSNDNNDSSIESNFETILIEGGSAFGTGDHPTSRMCSEWLLNECTSALQNTNENGNEDLLHVMDYGSGSGILAFVALVAAKRQNKLDKICVEGVEVDHIAIDSARRNAALNDFAWVRNNNKDSDETDVCKGNVQFYGPMNGTPGSELWDEITGIATESNYISENKSSNIETEIDLLPRSRIGIYDILIANILAQPLISLVPTISMLLKPDSGRLALSGIMENQVDCVIRAYSPFFDNMHVVSMNKGWVLLEGTRNSRQNIHPLFDTSE